MAKAIGTRHLRDLINLGLTQWRIMDLMETVAESGKEEWNPVRKQQIQPGYRERAGWTRDEIAEPYLAKSISQVP